MVNKKRYPKVEHGNLQRKPIMTKLTLKHQARQILH